MKFSFTPYRLPGLLLVDGPLIPDERGSFQESYREADFRAGGIPPLVQDNLSRSKKGVLRGLHYQKKPSAIGKLVRCLRGRIFDVAVDLRRSSASYGRWASIELSDEANRMLWVPVGFAHGFYTLSESADVLYKVTGYWVKADDCGVLYDDPAIGVAWPASPVILSPKDAALPPLARADNNFD